ncbi:MAG: Bug family tripartite tricarboxylate transporter substrate binding protein [Pseudorhodoplanes sp.]|uniref:Bug family tripartite tricarboxylate transporter substrate binding protein n=1 Tax=Pseudorhodoplanes sp. TaxID=1934341 RepID=UPI003D10FFC5
MKIAALGISVLVAGAMSLAVVASASAQTYPERPIRVVVGTGAGGVGDIMIRAIGEQLSKSLGQPLVIENRTGGAFNIPAKACAEAKPDGYTICLLPGEPVTYNEYLFKNIGFDPRKDFRPITNIFFFTQAFAANKSLGAKSVDELVAYSKEKPGTLSYSAPGLSHAQYVEFLKKTAGADLVRVPFKGGGDAVTGLLSNTTPVVFLGLGNVLSYIEAGTVVPFAVDGETRSPLIPETPTIRELGYKGDITRSYMGLFAPAGTPDAVITTIHKAVVDVLKDPQFQKQHAKRGIEFVGNTPDEFAAFIAKDRGAAERVVDAAGMRAK